MLTCIKAILVLLAAMPYSYAGEILQQGAHAVSSTFVRFLWAMLIPIACSGGAAFLIIGLRNFCDYIERRRMENMSYDFAADEEAARIEAHGGRVDILSGLMAPAERSPEPPAEGQGNESGHPD